MMEKNIGRKRTLIVVVSVLVCILSIIGGELDYAGNDDTFRNLISVGAFGDVYRYYIMFSNVLYGIPIALLNGIFPAINWYYWVMILVSIAAIASFCIVLFDKYSYGICLFGTIVVNISFSRDYYVAIQFTKTASLWIICGFIIIFASAIRRDKTWLLGVCFFAIGAACRMDCVYMVIPFAFVLVFFSMIRSWDKCNADNLKYVFGRFFLLFVIILILDVAEYSFRAVNPEWRDYWKYNRTSSYLLDQQGTDYNDAPNEYDAVFTDGNDIDLFMAWMFGDTDYYTIDWIESVVGIASSQNEDGLRINPQILLKTFKNMADAHYRAPGFSSSIIVLTLLLLVFFLIKGNAVDKLFALGNFCSIYVIYWYFTCVDRFMWRAELGAYVAIIIFMAAYYRLFMAAETISDASGSSHVAKLALILGMVFLLMFSGFNVYTWRYVKDKHVVANEADITGRLYLFNDNPNYFYMLTDFYVTNNPMSITKDRYNDIYRNSAYLGNWIIPSPVGMYYARCRGYENPMRALIEDNVYLHAIDSSIPERIRLHLSKTLGKEVQLVQDSDEIWSLYVR